MRKLITLAVLLALLCLSGWATTYYVATAAGGGDNSHNGLYPTDEGGSNGPWRTLAYAATHIVAGDTVQIRAGTYVEAPNFAVNGTSGSRITIDNYQDETVIIDGQDTLPAGSPYYFLVSVHGDYTTIRDLTIHDSHGSLLCLDSDYSYAINVIGIDSRETGIAAMGDQNLIDGCSMTNNGWGYGIDGQTTWGSAICTVGSNTTIQNCLSYENIGEGFNAYSTATDVIIQDCISYDNDSVDLYLDSVVGGLIQRNLIYNTITDLSSGIVVACETGSVSGLLICNNFVMGCSVNFEIDSNVTTLDNVDVIYNTFVNSTGPAGEGYNMGVYYRTNINTYIDSVFKNNIVLEDVSERVPISVESSHSGLTFSYNCWSETVIAAAQGTGDVVGDPKLAKTPPSGAGTLTANYFKLLGTSPAIGKGIYMASVLTDYFQTVRKTGTSPNGPDIGGYEYVSGGGPPPLYYVDSSITDTYVGSATPDFTTYNHLTFETTGGADLVYKTIADINACTFVPDDFIYFRRGQTWRETLTVPSSGTSGHSITFGAFGTGANPVFDPTVEYNDFILADISPTVVQVVKVGSASSDTVTVSYTNTPGEGNLLIAYGKGTTVDTNSSISGWTQVVSANHGADKYMALFYKVAGESETKDVVIVWTDSTATTLRIEEWTGLVNPVVDQVANANYSGSVTSKTSGTTATTTAAEELCIAVFYMSSTQGASVSWTNSFVEEYHGTSDEMGSLIAAAKWAAETTYTWTTARNCGGLIATFKATGAGKVWKRTLESTADILQVFQDGERMIYSADTAGMVQGSFCTDDDYVYVWCTDDGNPNTGHVIEYDPCLLPTATPASYRGIGVRLHGKSYLVFDSIDIYRACRQGYSTELDGTTNVIIRNCTVSFMGNRAILIGCDRLGTYMLNTSDVTISNVISHDNLSTNFWIGGTRTILEDSEAYNSGADCTPNPKNYPGPPTHFPAGINIGTPTPDSIVRRNYVHDNYIGAAIMCEQGDGNIIERNFVVSKGQTSGKAIHVITDHATVRYNIIKTEWAYGILIDINLGFDPDPTNPLIYNNTIISAANAKTSIQCEDQPDIVIKNNIIIRDVTETSGREFISVEADAESGFVADYNCYYMISGTPKWDWLGTTYTTFAGWQAASGQDAHGLYGNPLLVNAGGSSAEDYKLASDSPCINAGVNVGLTEDYEGNPIVGLPDIGAYEWQGVDRFPPRLPLRLPCRVPLRKGG